MRNLETGMEKEIYRSSPTERTPADLALSPDGERLAVQCVRPASLIILPVSGGEPQEVSGYGQVATRESPLAWTADGKHILFLGKATVEDKYELYRISAKGGNAEPLGLPMAGYGSSSAHPDGRKLLFAARETEATAQVWALENVGKLTALSP